MNKFLMLVGISMLIFQTSCKSEKHHEAEKEMSFLVTNPLKKDTTINKEYVCQIHAISHIEIRSQERGYLENIFIDEGKFVKKGQVMFQIMPNLYNAELQKAQAEADLAQIEYLNTKSLADSNIVSQNELAMTKAKFDRANAELSLAQVHLDFTKIKAPFDGIIDKFHVRLGSLIDEGELMTNLSDNRQMWVYFNVPEAEYLDYMTLMKQDDLQTVTLLMANNKMFDQKGVVETIEADFNNQTGNIAFRATFSNPNGLLRHGETGNILVPTEIKDAIIIPQKATFEILDKKYVFVVDENNIIKSRKIEIQQELPHLYIISEGINENDKILLDGLRKVRNNDKISYEFIEAAKALSDLNLYAE